MKQKLILIILLGLLITSQCKKETAKLPEPVSAENNPRLAETKKILELRKSSNEKLSGYPSVEIAVSTFLDEVCIKKHNQTNLKSILSQKERDFILYPNIYGSGTSLDVTPLEDYDKLIKSLENLAIEKLSNFSFEKAELKNIKIFVKSVKPYGKANFHKIGLISLKSKGEEIEITEIKSVLEFNGIFKVAILSP
ncbi:hypothetical protein JWG40_13815 [Leptospira sp. 201903074]|uniref:hypothetical protein n=1 Tax=Leptospira abararensis TaxID=2810036 RepID=UPI001966341B|nr:hypothetical protein [Leptospira abararensis]MBM9548102.1 hypothetical protein [Leptospira abararensis]